MSSTLIDKQIISLAESGLLITSEFAPERVKQACYELRASDIFYDLDEPDRRHVAALGDTILMKPKQMIVFITMESLDLPDDYFGRVMSKGQLFSLGLVPVNTFADPGFVGRLGIVMINASNEYLAIPPGTAIAKIEFVKLDEPVARPYSGQHGYETEIWPIANSFKLSKSEIKKDPRVGDTVSELTRAYGDDFGRVTTRVFRYERRLLIASALFVLLSMAVVLAIGDESIEDNWLAVVIGVLSNVLFQLILWFGLNLRRRK
ncbi:hypothetical protein MUN74_04375 [Agromyces endophyticus]|uniref:dCTP deaminase domain-containing protein n=1 Tax=Agromyces sp. H17E-10 TaxID=2932244 RepID=UPI001FD0BE06|nr:hypothetical protein [Agromyces sp. H17E-10]UOQ90160.1 hypothetical protein MUN74_04375 [Agromyces sp. H17E-10]